MQMDPECLIPDELAERRAKLVNELKNCASGLCEVLAATIPSGVAYHHSGLTPEEREIVERGYRRGQIMVLCATSTLSTGINLPAKAVLFRGGPMIAKDKMDAAKYKQMSGRAGRTGFDSSGDSIMICTKDEHENYFLSELLKPYKVDLTSALTGPRLMRAILEVIASGLTQSLEEVETFVEQTLVYQLASAEKCNHKTSNFECRECINEFTVKTLQNLE